MKLIIAFVFIAAFLLLTPSSYALDCTKEPDKSKAVECIFGKVTAPSPIAQLGEGDVGVSKVINTIISLIFIAAGIAVVFMLIAGALQLISSGGDKEKLAAAQKRITFAIVGLAMLALSFFILNLLGLILNFPLINTKP